MHNRLKTPAPPQHLPEGLESALKTANPPSVAGIPAPPPRHYSPLEKTSILEALEKPITRKRRRSRTASGIPFPDDNVVTAIVIREDLEAKVHRMFSNPVMQAVRIAFERFVGCGWEPERAQFAVAWMYGMHLIDARKNKRAFDYQRFVDDLNACTTSAWDS